MALSSPGERWMPGQEERREATPHLSKWAEDFETTHRSIPESGQWASDSSPAFKPTTYEDVDRSPYLLRGKRRRPGKADQFEKETSRRDRPEPSDDESAPKAPDTPSPAERRPHAGVRGTRRGRGGYSPAPILFEMPR
ncbi:hypothetical protein AUP68_10719 [Ilyonectria robusta]